MSWFLIGGCARIVYATTLLPKSGHHRDHMDFGGKCAALPWSWLGDLHRVCVCILLAGCCRMDVGYSKKSSPKWAPKRLNIGSLHGVWCFHMAGVILLEVTCDLTAGPFAARCSLKTMVILQSINEVLLRWGGWFSVLAVAFLGAKIGKRMFRHFKSYEHYRPKISKSYFNEGRNFERFWFWFRSSPDPNVNWPSNKSELALPGSFSKIQFSWRDADRVLTVSDRLGSFPGMDLEKNLCIVFVSEGHGVGVRGRNVTRRSFTAATPCKSRRTWLSSHEKTEATQGWNWGLGCAAKKIQRCFKFQLLKLVLGHASAEQ